MQDISWLIFFLTSVVIIITPGQDLILVMSRAITRGAAAGVATAAGVGTGLMAHTVLATLGVGAIVQASEWLFFAMKILGALYLLYLGITLLRTRSADVAIASDVRRSVFKLYLDGAISNMANPKIAIFYFAFLPQFVPPGADNTTGLIFLLGASFALLTFLIKAPVGIFAGRLSGWLRENPNRLLIVYRLSGLMLIGLGLRLATEVRQA
ncbi:MAG: LysE family translocator [Burkholderiaceae bacterium]